MPHSPPPRSPASRRPRAPAAPTLPRPAPSPPKRDLPGGRIAGIDEAGRGPWAGPVVAAAVILHRRTLPVRIDDSKRLTARQRLRAYATIVQHADIGVGIICARHIDRHNILQATFRAMRDALAGLRSLPDLALVDGSLAPPLPVPCRAVIGGDASVYEIACASIVAKVVRDRLMEFYDGLYPGFGFRQHKGYGTARHREQLQALGPCRLHRLTFQPVADALARGRVATGDGVATGERPAGARAAR